MIDIARQESKTQLRRAFLIGIVGGIAGSAAKLVGEAIIPPRKPGEEPPPAVLAEKVAGRPLSKGQKLLATQVFHWTFGSITGGVYSVLAEYFPQVTAGRGLLFGWAVMLLTHESSLPALGLSPAPWNQGAKEIISELITHGMYGTTTEAVRRWLESRNSMLAKRT